MRRTLWIVGLVVAALVALVPLAGCTAALHAPTTTPDMSGARVVAKSGGGDTWSFRMEVDVDAAKQAGIQDAGVGYTVASVRVDSKTVILRQTANGVEKASAQDVIGAAFLNVWFTGAVAESYPVQATTGTIVILQ